MEELKFVLKTFLFTLLFICLAQVKIGGQTLESQIQKSIRASPISETLSKVAHGALIVGHEGVAKVKGMLGQSKVEPSSQSRSDSSLFKFSRSKEYEKQKEQGQ